MESKVAGTLETWEYEWTHTQLRHIKVVDMISRYWGPPTPKYGRVTSLVDVGCGNGHITSKLIQVLGLSKAIGVEVLANQVSAPSGVEILPADIDVVGIPLDSSTCDLVHCGETIEHLFHPDQLLKEVVRVLRPGGYCVITTPNLASWANRVALSLGYQPFNMAASTEDESIGKMFLTPGFHGQWGHIRLFTMRSLCELHSRYGLSVLERVGWRIGSLDIHLKGGVRRFIELLDLTLSSIPSLAPRLVVVSRKG